jgi:CPA1 family monovalent cation:H+ antiporter
MDIILDRTVFLIITAVLVGLVARRMRLPYTVGLVLAGCGLAWCNVGLQLHLTHAFIFDVILPPLLFEAALNIHWQELKRDMLPILLLASMGVIVSAAYVAFSIHGLLDWPWKPALVFGVLIAATDPVAVIALFKDTGVKGRLRLLVEAESLFNDGVAAVFFALVLVWAQAENAAPMFSIASLITLCVTVAGGIAVGIASGMLGVLVAGRTADHLMETAITTAMAYGSFLFAEHMQVSGVLAAVAAGLWMGNKGLLAPENNLLALSDRGRSFILDFWEFVAFIANSVIFLLIGLRVATIRFHTLGLSALAVIIASVLVARALSVYPLCLPFARTRYAIPLRDQHILWWGGLRGALALALALSLPQELEFHDPIVVATFSVVTFSVLVQGITMPLLLKRLGFA